VQVDQLKQAGVSQLTSIIVTVELLGIGDEDFLGIRVS